MNRAHHRCAAWLFAALVGSAVAPAAAAPPDKPDAAAQAEAKKLFESGKKLLAEGSYREALAAFTAAKKIVPRESIQRNIAYCHRELKDFASAYEAYVELVDTFGPKMKKADLDSANAAIQDLKILSGSIRISVSEPGARVEINGREVGTTPFPKPIRVNVGTAKVAVAKAGFETIAKTVEIRGGDETTIDGALQKEVLTGHVVVALENAGDAKLLVDGREVAGPYPWEGDLPPGTHEVEAKGANAIAATKRFEVVKGQRVEINLRAEAQIAKLSIDGGAADAEILVDGKQVATGAWEGDVTPGRHVVRVQRVGNPPVDRVVIAHVGEVVPIKDITWAGTAAPAATAAPVAPPEPDYVGLYSHLDFFGTIAATRNELVDTCAQAPVGGRCDADNKSLGGGLAMRIGYSFGWLGLEGFALGAYDRAKASVSYANDVPSGPYVGVAREESYTFHRYGGGVGAALRATSMHPTIRFTGALGGGVAIRRMVYKREAVNNPDNASDSFTASETGYTAPLIVLDGGVLFGSTPGGKFHLGLTAMIELPGADVTADADSARNLGGKCSTHPALASQCVAAQNSPRLGTPSLRMMSSGAQLFIGPVLGIRFGE
jgi:hypothetical protein